MTTLRDQMLADCRARGVLLGRAAERDQLIDQMILGGESEDGTVVGVTAADWREVVAMLDVLHGEKPGLLAAILVDAMRDPGSWQDLVLGAVERRRLRSERIAAASVARSNLRPPTDVCVDSCRGAIEEGGDEWRGRWFCVRCGAEWVRAEATDQGFPYAMIADGEPWAGTSAETIFAFGAGWLEWARAREVSQR